MPVDEYQKTMRSVLLILYGFMYTILQLQDYLLLLGSIGLFIVLAVAMYLSRKIDWYSLSSNSNTDKE
jgi:inner membrane protein